MVGCIPKKPENGLERKPTYKTNTMKKVILFLFIAMFAMTGFSQTVATEVTLTGTAIVDTLNGGFVSKVLWTQVSGPANPKIETPSTLITKVTGFDTPGIYIYRFTVTDNEGQVATDDTKVTVLKAKNRAPVSKAGAEIIIKLPTK